MTTFTFSVHHLTLADLRSRVERKIKVSSLSDDVDGWINDVIQWITVEFPVEALISDGSDVITGDGTEYIFDLPADFQSMLYHGCVDKVQPIEGISPQEMFADYQYTSRPIRDPKVYTIVGRKKGVGDEQNQSEMADLRIVYDSIPTNTKTYRIVYHKLHHKLVNDGDPCFLPPHMHSLVVDGAILESSVFKDHEDYERHERKFHMKLNRAAKAQRRYLNRNVVMGTSLPSSRGKPGYPVMPETIS